MPNFWILYFNLRGAYTFIHSSTLLQGLKGVCRLPEFPLFEPSLTPDTFIPIRPEPTEEAESTDELLLLGSFLISPSNYFTICLLSVVVVSLFLNKSETVDVKSSLRMSNSILIFYIKIKFPLQSASTIFTFDPINHYLSIFYLWIQNYW